MKNCLNCEVETSNPKFCSKSCAVTLNNKLFPKRKRIRPIPQKTISRWEGMTLGRMRKDGNANFNSSYPYIRQVSRREYKRSGRPMACAVCGYSLHVEICHIRDIKFFNDDALVSEINDPTNLIALCKNHHWEYDHGFLVDPSVGLPFIVGKSRLGVGVIGKKGKKSFGQS